MAEKSARELAGKKLQRLLEERVVKLADMLENEQEERAKEVCSMGSVGAINLTTGFITCSSCSLPHFLGMLHILCATIST